MFSDKIQATDNKERKGSGDVLEISILGLSWNMDNGVGGGSCFTFTD